MTGPQAVLLFHFGKANKTLILRTVTAYTEWLLSCAQSEHVHWLNIWTCGCGCINRHAKSNIELSAGYERI